MRKNQNKGINFIPTTEMKKPYRNEFLIGMFKKHIYPKDALNDMNAGQASNLLFFMNEKQSVAQIRDAAWHAREAESRALFNLLPD